MALVCTSSLYGVRQDPVCSVILGVVDETIFNESQINACESNAEIPKIQLAHKTETRLLSTTGHRLILSFIYHRPTICGLTWDVTKVPIYAEVCVRGNDATLKDLLTHHRGKGVFGCLNVGLDQPRVLWTFKRERKQRVGDILDAGQ